MGLKGAGISFRTSLSQSNFLKNGCLFSSLASSSPPPNRLRGSFTSSLLIKSATSFPIAETIQKCMFNFDRYHKKCCGQFKQHSFKINCELPIISMTL